LRFTTRGHPKTVYSNQPIARTDNAFGDWLGVMKG
jgi:hypothetical protein